MKTTFLLFCVFILIIALPVKAFPQDKKDYFKSIGISIPIIWNNSETTQSSSGSNNYKSGDAISYGININHSRILYKNLFIIVGIGYYKQVFDIQRPFKFDDPTKLPFYTKSYEYDNIQFLAGLGYSKPLKNNYSINCSLTYNHFISFKQKYTPEYLSNSSFQNSQINHKTLSIGRIINVNLGLEKALTKRISIELDATLPLLTHWENDETFFKNYYYDNSQQIGRNIFSIGTIISCNYHF